MGYSFSKELLSQLKKCDLVAYFKECFPKIPIRKSGNYYIATCPHKDHEDHNPSFRIFKDPTTGWYSWTCFSCHNGAKGEKTQTGRTNHGTDAIAFVIWISDYKGSPHVKTFQEAVLELLRFFHLPVPHEIKPVLTKEERTNSILSEAFCQAFVGSEAERYLKKRNILSSTAQKYHVGTDGDRLSIPLVDHMHKIRGFIFRHLHGEEPKYIHSSARDGFIKSQYLFGLEYLDLSQCCIYLTEGCFDVMMADQYGVKNVLACLGTAFTEDHAKLLKSLGVHMAVLVFDGDQAGRHATDRAIAILEKQSIICRVIFLPDGMDLCDFAWANKEKTEEKLQQCAIPSYEYELQQYAAEYQRIKKQAQQQPMSEILKRASSFTDQHEYDLFRQYVYDEFDIRLEQNHVRKTEKDMEDPVPSQTAA